MPNLQEIKARRDGVTQGTWRIIDFRPVPLFSGSEELIHGCGGCDVGFTHEGDAQFVLHAPTDIDWLIAEAERLKAEKAHSRNPCFGSERKTTGEPP